MPPAGGARWHARRHENPPMKSPVPRRQMFGFWPFGCSSTFTDRSSWRTVGTRAMVLYISRRLQRIVCNCACLRNLPAGALTPPGRGHGQRSPGGRRRRCSRQHVSGQPATTERRRAGAGLGDGREASIVAGAGPARRWKRLVRQVRYLDCVSAGMRWCRPTCRPPAFLRRSGAKVRSRFAVEPRFPGS